MGIFERIADAIFRMATGENKRRWFYTALVAFLFACFLALFFIGAYFTDRWLNLASVVYMPWNLILGLILIVPGAIMISWTYIQFFKARGTPVPINPPQKLITTGLYAYSRNPMLLGIFLVFFGVGVLTGSLSLTFIFSPLLRPLLLLSDNLKLRRRRWSSNSGRHTSSTSKRCPGSSRS